PRPANAWILYRTDRLREMVEEGEKDVKQSNASKLIGKMWHHEKPEVRAMYEKRAELGRLEHARKHPGYKYRP
ncbi:high mobility group box domain-containing protein, partial [Trametes gibbosa]